MRWTSRVKKIGGVKHGFYFPFHIWDVILPIDELIFLQRYAVYHQPVDVYIYYIIIIIIIIIIITITSSIYLPQVQT